MSVSPSRSLSLKHYIHDQASLSVQSPALEWKARRARSVSRGKVAVTPQVPARAPATNLRQCRPVVFVELCKGVARISYLTREIYGYGSGGKRNFVKKGDF